MVIDSSACEYLVTQTCLQLVNHQKVSNLAILTSQMLRMSIAKFWLLCQDR